MKAVVEKEITVIFDDGRRTVLGLEKECTLQREIVQGVYVIPQNMDEAYALVEIVNRMGCKLCSYSVHRECHEEYSVADCAVMNTRAGINAIPRELIVAYTRRDVGCIRLYEKYSIQDGVLRLEGEK